MNIYVGNISYAMTDAALKALFGQFGEVESTRIIVDRETGRSKGFGFVQMPNREEGNLAISQLNGKEVDGRALRVNEAKEQSNESKRRGKHRSGYHQEGNYRKEGRYRSEDRFGGRDRNYR